MRPILLLSAVCALAALSADHSEAPSQKLTNEWGKEQERHPAPQVQSENAPPELQLSPPPEAERVQVPPGVIGLANPAFPVPERTRISLPLGRRYDAKDLAPYFTDGNASLAKAQFDRGRFAEAHALLTQEGDALSIRYLRAASALRGGFFEEAAGAFSALAKDYPQLKDRCLAQAARAFEELRQFQASAALYRQVPLGSRLHSEARLGLARALRRLADLEGALDALSTVSKLLAPAWGRDVGAEALLAVADVARQAKRPAAERDALVRIWSLHPLSSQASQIEQRLRSTSIPAEARVTRAEQLIEASRNRRGLALLEPLLPKLKLPDPLACRAHFAYGKALRKARLHARAIRALVPVVARCDDPELRARAMYVLGSSRSIADPARAPQTYEALATEFPRHSFADDALFYAADLHLRSGEVERGIALLQKVARDYPDGDFAADALFKLFWAQRARGARDAALEALGELEHRYAEAAESYEVERARYWKGRLLEQGGDVSSAVERFETLAEEHPATYYGFVARMRLRLLDPRRADRLMQRIGLRQEPASIWPIFAGVLGDDPHFLAAVELLRLGFADAVPLELLAVDRAALSADAIRLLVAVLAAAGDSRSAHALVRASLRGDLGGKIEPSNAFVWQIAYPNTFRDLVARHCGSIGVDPDLLQALIREESAFDPKAFSWAGALGLTQLMLPTARVLARDVHLPRIRQESLLSPELNIHLGAQYLGALLKRFRGNKAFALAAYNAGPGAVAQWPCRACPQELDAWIEDIPIAETRGYVKRVLRSYNSYKLLYANSQATETMSWVDYDQAQEGRGEYGR